MHFELRNVKKIYIAYGPPLQAKGLTPESEVNESNFVPGELNFFLDLTF